MTQINHTYGTSNPNNHLFINEYMLRLIFTLFYLNNLSTLVRQINVLQIITEKQNRTYNIYSKLSKQINLCTHIKIYQLNYVDMITGKIQAIKIIDIVQFQSTIIDTYNRNLMHKKMEYIMI